MDQASLFYRFGVALAIGLLIGLQREYAFEDTANHTNKENAAGIRTFTLLSLIGCSAACVAELSHSIWPYVAMIIGVAAFLTVNYYIEATSGKIGLTTKVAALITLLIGTLCYLNQIALAVALSVTVTVLLSVKIELHTFVSRITREDVFASLKLAVISAIVLPVLPDRSFGPVPFDIINPFKIWLFVVFISGVSFIGYILIKVTGAAKGIGLTGFLGGLASSTAVTLSFTPRSKQNPELSRSFALAITIAWTVMFLRVLIAVAVLNVSLVSKLWLPILVPMVFGLCYCFYLYQSERANKNDHAVTIANPFELGLALKFGLLFTVILLISKVAQVYMGNTGIYLSSIVSGLADVDAIALSMAKLSAGVGGIDPVVAVRAIVMAAMANTLLKGSFVLFSGAPALRKAILPGFIMMLVSGVVMITVIR